MILLNVRLIGSGTSDDPYRTNLPSSSLVNADYGNMVAIVSVDPATLGLTADDLKSEQAHPTTQGDLYTQLSADNLEKARAHLAKDYPGHQFALELVNG